MLSQGQGFVPDADDLEQMPPLRSQARDADREHPDSPLLSRKLLGALGAMAAVVSLMLGIAAIEPSLFQSSPEIVGGALAGILGLGGWQIGQQAKIDMNGGA